jgi:alpha-L-fucosidase
MLSKTDGEGTKIELAIPKDKRSVNQVVLMERIECGERVREFALEAQCVDGGWRELYKGSSIGHKHIVRFDRIEAFRLRLTVAKSAGTPLIRDFSAYCN